MYLEYSIVLLCSLLSIGFGAFTTKKILKEPQGSDRMVEIASAIQEGAQAYLNRQYITISVVGILITVILYFLIHNPFVAIGFVIELFIWTGRLCWNVCICEKQMLEPLRLRLKVLTKHLIYQVFL